MAVAVYGVPDNPTSALPERFERKYYLAPPEVGMAYGLLRQICLPAPDYPSEQINSLYLDTPDLSQHETSESGDYCKDKVRIRWYGESSKLRGMQPIYLELKSRRGFAGTKQRLRLEVPVETLMPDNLCRGILPWTLVADALARFGYFPSDILLPIAAVSYWRYRFCEIVTGQRVSLDCRIRSTMMMPGLGIGEDDLELVGGVVEIKGRTMELPRALRYARILHADWTRFSKYSACIDANAEMPGMIGRLSPSGRVVQP